MFADDGIIALNRKELDELIEILSTLKELPENSLLLETGVVIGDFDNTLSIVLREHQNEDEDEDSSNLSSVLSEDNSSNDDFDPYDGVEDDDDEEDEDYCDDPYDDEDEDYEDEDDNSSQEGFWSQVDRPTEDNPNNPFNRARGDVDQSSPTPQHNDANPFLRGRS